MNNECLLVFLLFSEKFKQELVLHLVFCFSILFPPCYLMCDFTWVVFMEATSCFYHPILRPWLTSF